MIRTIIFDFDGVIHDTMMLAYGINQKLNPWISLEEYKDLFNGNFYASAEQLKGKKTLVSGDAFFDLQEQAFKGLKTTSLVKRELFKLKEKYALFIVTSNRESTLQKYLETNGLLEVFTAVLGFETHPSKVEKFKMLFDRYSLLKQECVFITDTLGDLLEAQNVGLRAIALDSGFHDRARLEKGNPLRIISKFEEIFPAIKLIS